MMWRKKLRDNVASISSKSNGNSQSSSNKSLANQTNFAVLITSPKDAQRKSNGKGNSSDENDDRLPTKDDNDESSLSRLISYLTEKEAAGVINIPSDQETVVAHIFPPCQFSKKFLRVICPSMSFSNGPRTPPSRPTTNIDDEHLIVVLGYND